MAQLAILFAGQGSQQTGMGLDVLQAKPSLQSFLDEANATLGCSLLELLSSSDGRLNQTIYTQPAIVFTSLLLFTALQQEASFPVAATAGFSLGEYSALAASGVFAPHDIYQLIRVRAAAMHEAALSQSGKMAALLGAEQQPVETLCHQLTLSGRLVSIANLNCPGQIVISGTSEGVDALLALAPSIGVRRIIPVNVSGAFHSPLMASAIPPIAQVLQNVTAHPPQFPIYMNVTAAPLFLPSLDELMKQQIVSSVRFEETLRAMQRQGVTHFLEIGPGSVLSGFVKKTLGDVPCEHVSSWEDILRVKGWLTVHGI